MGGIRRVDFSVLTYVIATQRVHRFASIKNVRSCLQAAVSDRPL